MRVAVVGRGDHGASLSLRARRIFDEHFDVRQGCFRAFP